jgi:hypothetical protein
LFAQVLVVKTMNRTLGIGALLLGLLAAGRAADHVTLLPVGAAGKFHVPTSGALGTSWTAPGFTDAGWSNVITPVGFDMPKAPIGASGVIADSVAEFSGAQGSNNWYYGYWDRGADQDGTFQNWEFIPFPREAGNNTLGANNYWNGSFWDWFNGNPPWTELTASGGRPSHSNGGPGAHHYVVRRWISEINGPLHLVGTISEGGECGDGVDLRVYVDGNEVATYVNVFGMTVPFAVNVEAQIGSTIDFAVGPNATSDSCDGFGFSVKVMQNTLADSVEDFSGVQGARGWSYGYYDKSVDGNATYDANTEFNTTNPNWIFTSGAWSLGPGDPPLTSIGQTDVHPNSGPEHWAIRRWTSTYAGRVRIAGTVVNADCGGDVNARIFINGAQVFSRVVANSGYGFSLLANVTVGSRIDFAVDPNGADGCDATRLTATIQPVSAGAMVVADSAAEFSSAQGQDNWYYGFYNKSADGNAIYDPAIDFNTTDPNWAFSGSWLLGAGDPPWTALGAIDIHPNGVNNGDEHWVVRRWVSKVTGAISIDWHFGKSNPNGSGSSLLVFQNGVLRDSASISGDNRAGVQRVLNLSVQAGDRIDFAQTPIGPGGETDDGADDSVFNATIYKHAYSPVADCTPVADSQLDWSMDGQQGFRGWHYGYYNKSLDATPGYQAADFTEFASQYPRPIANWSPTDNWTGADWLLSFPPPPWTFIGKTIVQPNGTSSGDEHWVIRRWISTVSGTVRVDWFARKQTPFGGAVVARVMHNGMERDSAVIQASDQVGANRALTITGVSAGDSIDLLLAPQGAGVPADSAANGMTVYSCVSVADGVSSDIVSQMKNTNSTGYLRLPFYGADPACIDQLRLRIRYDDGFVAYLNGVEVARRNAPILQSPGHFADSVADWSFGGIQGANNWFYGFYNQTADSDGIYDPTTDFNISDPNWAWTGSAWELGPNSPPWDTIGQYDWHPNGINNGQNHWMVRRWVSEFNGAATVSLRFAKGNTSCGNGVTGRLHRNGTLIYSNTIAFGDNIGVNIQLPVSIAVGDKLDFSIDALGTDGGTDDSCDGTSAYMHVRRDPVPALTWDSRATAERTATQALTTEVIDISAFKSALVPGVNVLAIHGLNRCLDDADFLLGPEITATVLPPSILVQPASRTNILNDTAAFTVSELTCLPASYQWRSNGVPIPGGTAGTLLVPALLANQLGYDVIVANVAGSVTSAVATLTVNRRPIAGDNGASTAMNTPVTISLIKLLNNDSDPDGDPISIAAFASPTVNGGSVIQNGNSVTYTPPAGFTGTDTFVYTLRDNRGGSNTAAVVVFIYAGTLPPQNSGLMMPVPGGLRIRFAGIPGNTYRIQRATTLGPLADWMTLQTLVAPVHGIMEFVDTDNLSNAFYRTLSAP